MRATEGNTHPEPPWSPTKAKEDGPQGHMLMRTEVVRAPGDFEVEIVCSAPVITPTNKSAILVRKLMQTLNHFEQFTGNAVFVELPNNHQPKGIHSTIDVTPLHLGNYISYRCSVFLDGPASQATEALGEDFKKECRAIHRKIEEIVLQYSVENKPQYWMSILEKFLKKQKKLSENESHSVGLQQETSERMQQERQMHRP